MFFNNLSSIFLLGLAALFLSPQPACSTKNFPVVFSQAYVGAADFGGKSMVFSETSDSDPGIISKTNLSTMPYLGLSVQCALGPGQTHVGIDTSLLVGWRSRKSSVSGSNGDVRIEIDSELWLLDLSIGPYVQTVLGNNWRVYAALGPMLLFGEYSDDTNEENLADSEAGAGEDSHSDSAFGVGGYAKLGLEYAISGDAYIGIAVRGITTSLEFERARGDEGLNGVQAFVSFTRVYW